MLRLSLLGALLIGGALACTQKTTTTTTTPPPATSSPAPATAPGEIPPLDPGQIVNGVDLPGMDMRSFIPTAPDPALCQRACEEDPRCLAFSYVRPGASGVSARCWLKEGIPTASLDDCCHSGVVRTEPAGQTLDDAGEDGLARANYVGGDIRGFDLEAPDPALCRAACEAEEACVGFTYVRPGFQSSAPRCWLKHTLGEPRGDACCLSGTVERP